VPLRSWVRTSGQLERAERHVLRSEQSGFIEQVWVEPGQRVGAGDVLVSLGNPQRRHRLLEAEAAHAASRIKARAYREDEPARAVTEARLALVHQAEVARRSQQLAKLTLHAPVESLVLGVLDPSEEGRFVQSGEPIATLGAGEWRLRALLTADEIAAASPRVGQRVELRAPAEPGRTFTGEVLRIAPAGSRSIDIPALTHVGGGEIPVDEVELVADQPYFELLVAVDAADAPNLHDGMTAQVRLQGGREPLAVSTFRRLLRVINRISKA
jgi:multidrug resistance efflux pump